MKIFHHRLLVFRRFPFLGFSRPPFAEGRTQSRFLENTESTRALMNSTGEVGLPFSTTTDKDRRNSIFRTWANQMKELLTACNFINLLIHNFQPLMSSQLLLRQIPCRVQSLLVLCFLLRFS